MDASKDVVEKRVNKGFRILNGKEKYSLQLYSDPCDAAEAEFREALRIDPNCSVALLGLGRCYSSNPRRYEEAISLFLRAMEAPGTKADASYQIGLTFLHAGGRGLAPLGKNPNEEALRYFKEALESDYSPKAWLYNHIGTAYYRLEEFDEALIWFEKSAESIGSEGGWVPSTYFLAAEACEYLCRFSDAVKWYHRYKEHSHLGDAEEINKRIQNLRILEKNRRKAL